MLQREALSSLPVQTQLRVLRQEEKRLSHQLRNFVGSNGFGELFRRLSSIRDQIQIIQDSIPSARPSPLTCNNMAADPQGRRSCHKQRLSPRRVRLKI